MDAINTLLVQRSANYSDRIHSRHFWSVAFMNCGQKWRDHRRTFHQFFNRKEVHQFRPIIEEEIPILLKALLSRPDDFREATHHFFGTIIMRAAYGADDPEYNKKLTMEADVLVGFLPSMQHIPSWFPGAGWRRALEDFAIWNDRFISVPFKDTKARMRNGSQKSLFRSMAVELIEELPKENTIDLQYRRRKPRHVAGADTTVSTALSVMLALTMHPDIQRKAQEQIDSVVGQERLPTFSDFEKLPYLQAVIKEAGRWHAVVPLALPHVSTEEDIYEGMRIPAGTMVMPNGWAVMHDPKNFDDPFEFKPERYLKSNGQIDSAVLDHHSTSFGYGRRVCPGRYLSDDTLTSMTAAFLLGQKEPLTLRASSNAFSPPVECRIEPRSRHYFSLINNL
ncbi:cytochrome P450 [Coprinopsis sp. MPI-PUGE-AT-0042]|nr:cytochrome P450 [Coprinopsis sp. MPI-PUGE-AT-0042]